MKSRVCARREPDENNTNKMKRAPTEKVIWKTEPQSPVSDALEQAVRWGKMSFRELMEDLVANKDARDNVFKRTGSKPDGEDEAG